MGFFRKKSSNRQSRPKKRGKKSDRHNDVKDVSTLSPKKKRSASPKEKLKKSPRENSPKKERPAKFPPKLSPRTKKQKSSPRRGKKNRLDPLIESLSIVHPSGDTSTKYPPLFCRDGVRRVDFILVTTKRIIGIPENMKILSNYVENLKSRNIFYEFEYGKIIENLFFIKINVLDYYIQKLALDYHITLTYTNPNFEHDKRIKYRWLQNDLNTPYMDDLLYERSISVSGDRPTNVTGAERSLLAYKVLTETPFGNGKGEIGYNALIKQQILIDAYPLHDGSHSWTKTGPLSDRQLLWKYWANLKQTFKIQPLNLIEKYFGTDNAFYFAWVGFYIKMLSIASALGLFFFIIGAIYYSLTEYKDTRREVCKSTILLCPACTDFNVCKFEKLKNSCNLITASSFFDNNLTIIFAIIMSIWSLLFLIYWKRYESRLCFRWNVRNFTVVSTTRYEYLEVATETKTLANGESYVRVRRATRFFHVVLTYSTCAFLVVLLIALLFGYIIYRVGVRYSIYISKMDGLTKKSAFIVSITGSVFIYCFIGIFGKVYESVALVLTRFEYHRTEMEHDNSYTYKMAALSLANNYAAITYLAFFKGRFYTYPGNRENIHVMFGLGEDICTAAGCLIDLTIQLASIMVSRSIVTLTNQFIFPYLKFKYNKLRYHRKNGISIPQWEEEFVLSRTPRYYLIYEWTSMLVQYGFVTFYVAALPLAPIMAWLNNIVEMRIDAMTMIKTKRRPIPQRTPGIGPYKIILKAMTIAGIATNAFVIAFTTDLIPRFMYSVSDDPNSYRMSHLSKFKLSDFPNYKPSGKRANATDCYYPGHRHPPGHKKQYTLNETYWRELAYRFAFVLLFEHILVTISGILAYTIPKQSRSLELESNEQEIAMRAAKNLILNEERDKKKKRKPFAFRRSRKGAKAKDPSMA